MNEHPASSASDEQIEAAIARARQSPFYQRHLDGIAIRSRAELRRAPLTTKDHLRDASPNGMLIVPRERAWHYHETSGTTGEPISTWCGLPEVQQMGAIVHRMTPELSQPSMLLNRFPLFAPVSFVFEEAMRTAGYCHIAAGNLSWDVPFDRALDFLIRLEATALSSLPLEPILLREVARTKGISLPGAVEALKVLFLGGAILPPAMRRMIERDFGARIVEIYGSNETLLMGVGCTAGRLHVSEELVEMELLDAQSQVPVAPGELGVVTITSLVHTVAPLVRYFTGDLARAHVDACACGTPGRTIEVFGRFDDVIRWNGVRLSHYELLDACYDFVPKLGARIFFVVIQPDKLRLLVEVDHPANRLNPSAESELAARVKMPIEVEYLAENDVLDRSALFRTPKIYKPSQISDWRGSGRKTITIMEALLEWPKFDRATIYHLIRRQIASARRRRRFLRDKPA
ncbi:MAG TPA: hypothetical protein VEB21_11445 [Terriglobales bacterium]|nr:hypothetical protein [Terriglobales bacterium]